MKPPRRLKGEFSEIARNIINEDRAARRMGRTQNTIGSIARALERAFEAGTTFKPQEDDNALTWMTLPPRGRAALDRICFGATVSEEAAQRVFLSPCHTTTGSLRWVVGDPAEPQAQSLADGGVAPLLRLGVLERLTDGRVTVTGVGRNLYAEYRRRRAAAASLPLEGFR